MTTVVLIQGAGDGAHDEDAVLAESLREHLGPGFTVDFPPMPDEHDPDLERWRPAIGAAIARARQPLVLVGHSAGAFLLLCYLAEERSTTAAATCIIAAPFPGGDRDWTFDGFELPHGVESLAGPILLYASEDDEIVPFAHRALWAAAIPHAVERTTTGGHPLGGDLRVVADDIRSATS